MLKLSTKIYKRLMNAGLIVYEQGSAEVAKRIIEETLYYPERKSKYGKVQA